MTANPVSEGLYTDIKGLPFSNPFAGPDFTFIVRGRTLTGDGYEGIFDWVAGDFSAALTVGTVTGKDLTEGVIIIPTADTSNPPGKYGAYVRRVSDMAQLRWFRWLPAGPVSDTDMLNYAGTAARYLGLKAGNEVKAPGIQALASETYGITADVDWTSITKIDVRATITRTNSALIKIGHLSSGGNPPFFRLGCTDTASNGGMTSVPATVKLEGAKGFTLEPVNIDHLWLFGNGNIDNTADSNSYGEISGGFAYEITIDGVDGPPNDFGVRNNGWNTRLNIDTRVNRLTVKGDYRHNELYINGDFESAYNFTNPHNDNAWINLENCANAVITGRFESFPSATGAKRIAIKGPRGYPFSGTVRNYAGAPFGSSNLQAGDHWFDTTNNPIVIKVYASGSWQPVTINGGATPPSYTGKLTSASTAPSGAAPGDWWTDTSSGNAWKIYSSTTWYPTFVNNTAVATPPLTGTSFYQSATPTNGAATGDWWVDTSAGQNNKLYVYGGGIWNDNSNPDNYIYQAGSFNNLIRVMDASSEVSIFGRDYQKDFINSDTGYNDRVVHVGTENCSRVLLAKFDEREIVHSSATAASSASLGWKSPTVVRQAEGVYFSTTSQPIIETDYILMKRGMAFIFDCEASGAVYRPAIYVRNADFTLPAAYPGTGTFTDHAEVGNYTYDLTNGGRVRTGSNLVGYYAFIYTGVDDAYYIKASALNGTTANAAVVKRMSIFVTGLPSTARYFENLVATRNVPMLVAAPISGAPIGTIVHDGSQLRTSAFYERRSLTAAISSGVGTPTVQFSWDVVGYAANYNVSIELDSGEWYHTVVWAVGTATQCTVAQGPASGKTASIGNLVIVGHWV